MCTLCGATFCLNYYLQLIDLWLSAAFKTASFLHSGPSQNLTRNVLFFRTHYMPTWKGISLPLHLSLYPYDMRIYHSLFQLVSAGLWLYLQPLEWRHIEFLHQFSASRVMMPLSCDRQPRFMITLVSSLTGKEWNKSNNDIRPVTSCCFTSFLSSWWTRQSLCSLFYPVSWTVV